MKDVVLVIDSDSAYRAKLRHYLQNEGIRTVEAVDGTNGLHKFGQHTPNLVILDIAIGQPNGFEICRQIRKISDVPIIILTARVDEIDEAMGFSVGANDYIRKPVSKSILILRVLNQLARKNRSDSADLNILEVENLTLNLFNRELRIGEKLVEITRSEFEFIHLLMEDPGRVYTREQVSMVLGTADKFTSDHLLDTHASRLRLKILAAGGPRTITAVRGVGYRFI